MKVEYVAYSTPIYMPLNKKEVYLEKLVTLGICTEAGLYSWTVPKGFVSDLRSGPAIANAVLGKWGDTPRQCALVFGHDFMYCKDSLYTLTTKDGTVIEGTYITKEQADAFFIEGLRWDAENDKGLHPGKCWAIKKALKWFGGSHFQNDPIRIYNTCKQEIETCR